MLQNILSPLSTGRASTRWLRSLLTLLLLAAAPVAFGQSATVIYGLVNVYRTTVAVSIPVNANTTINIPSYPKGTQTLISIRPGNGLPFGQGNSNLSPLLVPISGVTAGQILVGIDVRPSNGALYGLGYDTLTTATQVYRLTPLVANALTTGAPNSDPTIISGAIAVAVGPAIQLPLGNISMAATSKRIGFDFNPAADLIRVVSANRQNYRLSPNNGALVGTDTPLSYTGANVSVPVPTVTGPASTNPPGLPGVGTVAYTNSQFASTSTQLYAYDELDRGILSRVPEPNSGILTNPIAASFFITNSPSGQGPFIITPKLVALDIDFYYNRALARDSAYLLEVTADQPGGYHASNLYRLDVSNNRAARVNSIFPNPTITPTMPAPTGAGNNPFSLDVIDIAAGITAPLVWSGFVSDEWTNPLNWIPNRVPTINDDVLIPGTYTPGNPLNTSTFPGSTPTPNQPVVRVPGQVAYSIRMNTVATLTLVSPGSLNVATNFINNGGTVNSNGGALTVSGDFVNTNGAVNSTSGAITISGSFTSTGGAVAGTGGTVTVGGSFANTGGTVTGNGVTLTVGGSVTNTGTLTLNSGSTLSLGGNFTNTGGTVGGSGTGRLALTGSVVQTIGGTLSSFPNLTVSTAAAVTNGPINILSTGGVILNGNLAIGSGQAFTLLSTASGTAYVANNNGAIATGAATVQRYITPTNLGLGYRHYSSPVRGTTVADFTTTNFTPVVNPVYNTSPTPPTVSPFPTVYAYEQSRLSLTNTSPEFDKGFFSPTALTDQLIETRGYTVNIAGTELVDFVGGLNTGTYNRPALVRGPQTDAGFQFLGNPYPGAINYDILRANSSGIESALYVFKSSGQYTGTYTSYVNGASSNTGSNIIPTAQGFFVRVATGQTGLVSFTDAARLNAPDNTPFQRSAIDARPHLAITLRNAAIANQTYVYFEQGATAGFDAGFDAHYIPATHGLDLATETSTEKLSISGQPELTAATTVPLVLHAAAAGTYTLAVDELANLPAGYHAYLRDALTGTYTDLTTTPSISLSLVPTAAATGRYALVFSNATALATAPAATAQLVSLYPNPAHGTVSLLLPQVLRTGTATEVTVVDNLGRTVLSRTLSATATTLDLPLDGLSAGIYSVQAQTTAGVVAKRLVVK
ncbi:MAG: DUF4394 domain-containing protein [Hymenobacter sp.]|nr:MAG: DUF4394 domain-containing protein [Hymenobacter sp.]